MSPDEIRIIALKGIFSKAELENILTLKGGNAMKLQELTNRESQDLDLSIKESIRLSKEEDGPIFEEGLQHEFEKHGYKVIDFRFEDKPAKRQRTTPPFWGGYAIQFSIIKEEQYNRLSEKQLANVNAFAEPLEGNKKRIQIDLSFDEFTNERIAKEIDGVTIYLYSPLMIIYEKIRASCQQLPQYELSSTKVRARDLYDIYTILTNIRYIDLYDDVLNQENFFIIQNMFKLKDVDVELISKIETIKEQLRNNYLDQVVPQIPKNQEIPEFDYLFSYNMELFQKLSNKLLDK